MSSFTTAQGWYLFPLPVHHPNSLPISIPSSQEIKKKKKNRSFPQSTVNHYQSSSSAPLPRPCMLACLALNASANPPAKLDPPEAVLLGVSRPLSLPTLTALSLGVGASIGCFRTAAFGRFAGGAGGLGLPCLVVEMPLVG